MTNRVAGQYASSAPTAAPSRPARGTPPTGATNHSSDNIVRIVLRGLCGYETVGAICQAEGISRHDYNNWRRDFVQACKDWTHNDAHVRSPAGREYAAVDDEQFSRLAIEQANDIIERADDRLATAWLIEQQMSSRQFTDVAMP